MKKRSGCIAGILVAAVFMLITGCDAGGGNGDNVYAIGDTGPSGVGIVFYITDGGLHGLEVAPNDQSTSHVWIEGGSTQNTMNGNTLTDIGTGLANSNAIIAQSGHTGSAAQVCRDYNGGGLTDWFLPSQDELYQLYLQRNSIVGLTDGCYWSSSESTETIAMFQNFNDGQQLGFPKNTLIRVRAVRAF